MLMMVPTTAPNTGNIGISKQDSLCQKELTTNKKELEKGENIGTDLVAWVES